jgi:carbon-monoxide dehydrogenase medium subunit
VIYAAPESLDEAVQLLDDGGRILGGGTWVVPELDRGGAWPRRIVDLRRAGLASIEPHADGLRIGAMTTYADLLASQAVAERAPLLRLVAGEITGGWTIRNQGTVGGSVASARPQSDLPAALVAADAEALVVGPHGERRAAVHELLSGSLGSREIIAAFVVPAVADAKAGYVKLKRGASSWPIATAAALVALDAAGRCTRARLVLGGVAAAPVVVDVAEALVGAEPAPDRLADAGRLAGDAVVEPLTDALAPGDYRAAVAPVIARRALAQAFGRWN